MYTEDDLLSISALQHIAFCERQCALIHIEQQWVENHFTAEGRVMHNRAHEPERKFVGDILVVRGLRIRSLELGLSGIADVVEFNEHLNIVRPVEYKRGKPKLNSCDEAQLCGQAICLEEMMHVSISDGVLYYGSQRRRQPVSFTESLRSETRRLAARLHTLVDSGVTPPANHDNKCEQCSLFDICMPGLIKPGRGVQEYIKQNVENAPSTSIYTGDA